MMDNFFTWDMLATFAGCMAATIVLTEFTKKFIKIVPAQAISFIYALAILIVGQVVTKTFTPADILLDIVNAVTVSLSANGGFDAIKGVVETFKHDDNNTGAIVVDTKDPAGSYLQMPKDPKNLVDGEELTFKVKTV